MNKRSIPYTADDLRTIADKVDEIVAQIGEGLLEEDDWRWGLIVDVVEPESGEIVGQIRPWGDGWLAFYPHGVED